MERTCVCTAWLAGLPLLPCSLPMADEHGLYSSCIEAEHKARLFLLPEGARPAAVRSSWRRSARGANPGAEGQGQERHRALGQCWERIHGAARAALSPRDGDGGFWAHRWPAAGPGLLVAPGSEGRWRSTVKSPQLLVLSPCFPAGGGVKIWT